YRFSDVIADLGDNKITGSVVFDLSGQWPQVTAALASQKLDLRPVSFPANFGITAANSIADLGPFTLVINAVGPLGQLSVEKLDFQAGNENLAKISLQGSVKDLMSQRGIRLNFLIQGKNIANLEKLVNRPMPIQGAFKASGKIADLAEKNYSFNTLDVRISDSDIGGSVDLNLAGQRPQINASLVSAKINLKSILSYANRSAAAAVKPARAAMNSEKTSPGLPFPLDTLKAVDARIKFLAGQLLVPELRVNRIAVDLLLQDGDLMVTAEGPTLPNISELAGVNGLSRLGPYKFSVRAGGRGGRLVVEKFNFTTGKQEIAEIKITAAVDDLMALSGIEGRFTARGIDIANLAPLVGQPLPFNGSFTAAGNLSVPEINFYRVSNIEIVAGQDDVSGRVDLNLSGKRPRLSASLSSHKLDLRPLLENADDQDPGAKKYGLDRDRKNKASATHPQPLELLTMADVEFKVQVAKLLVPNLLINHFNLNFNLRDGRYNITAESRATPDISELTGVKGLSDLGPSKLILKGVATADKLTVERLNYHAGTQEVIEIKLNGSAEDLLTWRGITSSFMISGNDAANLERFTKQPVPYKGPFIVSGRLTDPAHQIYNFDQIRIAIGDSNLAGWSDINLTGDRPRVKAELTSRKLDLGWLYSETDPEDTLNRPSTKAGKERKKVFPNNPLPLDMLKLADLDLKIRAEEILLPRLTMRNLTAAIILDDEHLMAEPFKFSAGDGSVQGYIDLHTEGEALALATEIDIDQILLSSSFKEFDVGRTLKGTIDAKIKISGRGDSVAALMAGLNGTITLAHRGGQIANRYFNLIFGDLTTELVQRINVFSRKQDYTEVNCFVSHFDINDGLAIQAFVLDTPQSTLSGAGNLNLKTESLDLGFKTVPKKGVKVPGLGKVSLSLGELSKPFKIGGTLSNPSLGVDPTRTAVTFGKVIGGFALGPAGLAIVFGEVSLKDVDPCLEAFKATGEPVGNVDPEEKKNVKKKRWWQK
ncbi:MAG: AsmA family protein, partial [Planctomycetota bacterium]